MGVRVLAPGAMTTVQDLGRTGWRHLGVGLAGALDRYSHTIANLWKQHLQRLLESTRR